MKGRTIVSILAAGALLGALALTVWLARFVHDQTIPFDTDEGDHALPALDLLTAVLHRDAGAFGRTIAAQAFYPPVHSLFCLVSLLVFGPTHFAARLPSLLFFFATAVILALATYRHVRARGSDVTWLPLGAATITFVLAITSPEAVRSAVLCMLESLGTLWCALLLSLAVSEARSSTPPRLTGLALTTLAMTLTKYSFGIATIAAVGCAILLQHRPNDRWSALRRAVWFGVCVGVGLGAWLLITDPYSATRFVTSQESSGPVLGPANLLFDVEAWFRGYFASPVLSLAVLPMIVAAMYSASSLFSVRLAGLLLVFAGVMVFVSTTNETRHFLFALPAAWYLSGVGAAVLLERIARGRRARERAGWGLPASIALLVLLVGFFGAQRLPQLGRNLRRALEGQPEFAELQEAIATHVDTAAPILADGFSDSFSLQGLRFVLARRASIPSTALRLDAFPFEEKNFQLARDRKRHVDRPFLDPPFPRAPLSAVIEQRYYRHAVQLQRISKPRYGGQPAEEFRQALGGFSDASYRAGDWRVVIWNLGDGPP